MRLVSADSESGSAWWRQMAPAAWVAGGSSGTRERLKRASARSRGGDGASRALICTRAVSPALRVSDPEGTVGQNEGTVGQNEGSDTVVLSRGLIGGKTCLFHHYKRPERRIRRSDGRVRQVKQNPHRVESLGEVLPGVRAAHEVHLEGRPPIVHQLVQLRVQRPGHPVQPAAQPLTQLIRQPRQPGARRARVPDGARATVVHTVARYVSRLERPRASRSDRV
eukprot:1194670-Prorocentrum_minimum.AAC.4